MATGSRGAWQIKQWLVCVKEPLLSFILFLLSTHRHLLRTGRKKNVLNEWNAMNEQEKKSTTTATRKSYNQLQPVRLPSNQIHQLTGVPPTQISLQFWSPAQLDSIQRHFFCFWNLTICRASWTKFVNFLQIPEFFHSFHSSGKGMTRWKEITHRVFLLPPHDPFIRPFIQKKPRLGRQVNEWGK